MIDELYKRVYNKALAVCFKYCNNNDKAKDYVHDGFEKIIKLNKPIINDGTAINIIKNNMIDDYRKKKNNDIISFGGYFDEIIIKVEDSIDEDTLTFDDMLNNINRLKMKLSPRLKKTLELRLGGCSYKEIAEKLNINIGTVKSNMFIIKNKLNNCV